MNAKIARRSARDHARVIVEKLGESLEPGAY